MFPVGNITCSFWSAFRLEQYKNGKFLIFVIDSGTYNMRWSRKETLNNILVAFAKRQTSNTKLPVDIMVIDTPTYQSHHGIFIKNLVDSPHLIGSSFTPLCCDHSSQGTL